ncbi:MAG TPA: NAD-binding, UDP-glucose/GDP-mannose dehydrogenase [Saprospirales bacterium]|jgi:UDPglucose 6-dehydrogenase|nr:NAD-binding, UDP-glucose/GDP-mannose dehydrogenase [Saprospirales bacterium]
MSNITFLGVGKLGKDCAEVFASKGHTVTGYDINPFESDYITQKDTMKEAIQGSEIIFVALPTPHHADYDGRYPTSDLEPKDFDYTILKSVVEEANQYCTKEQLMVIISTTMPGTIREQIAPLASNVRLVYNPYLIALGTIRGDVVNPEMVMIGTENGDIDKDAHELISFYDSVMENEPRVEIFTWEECELTKIFYNTFISAKIVLVNLIQDLANKIGNSNVDTITNALARCDSVIMGPKFMKGGMGDGGPCHPRDMITVRWIAEKYDLGYDLFGSIMTARERQALNMAEYLMSTANGLPVCVVGTAYKKGVPFEFGSSSIMVGHYLKEIGCDVSYYDPDMCNTIDASINRVYLLAHGDDYNIDFTTDSIIVDPWRTYTSDKNFKIIHYGNTKST